MMMPRLRFSYPAEQHHAKTENHCFFHGTLSNGCLDLCTEIWLADLLTGNEGDQAAGTPRGFTFLRMNATISSMGVPGLKIPATPAFLSVSKSCSGMIPPTRRITSSILFLRRSSVTRGTIAL